MSTNSNATEQDQADGRVTIQLLEVPTTLGTLRDSDPVPRSSYLNIAVQTDRDGDEPSGLTACLNEHTKRILIRVLVVVCILIALAVIAAIETTIGADIINTDELIKIVKGEVGSLINNNASAKQV